MVASAFSASLFSHCLPYFSPSSPIIFPVFNFPSSFSPSLSLTWSSRRRRTSNGRISVVPIPQEAAVEGRRLHPLPGDEKVQKPGRGEPLNPHAPCSTSFLPPSSVAPSGSVPIERRLTLLDGLYVLERDDHLRRTPLLYARYVALGQRKQQPASGRAFNAAAADVSQPRPVAATYDAFDRNPHQ